MCEPSHSVIQYPTEKELKFGTEHLQCSIERIKEADATYGQYLAGYFDIHVIGVSEQANAERYRTSLGQVFSWAKMIDDFYNFSKIGSGHSESIEWAKTKHYQIPTDDTRYEGQWWNRTFIMDGPFNYLGLNEHRMMQAVQSRYSGTVDEYKQTFVTSFKRWFTDRKSAAFESAKQYHEQTVIGNMKMLRRFLEESMLNSDSMPRYIEQLISHVFKPTAVNQLKQKLAIILGHKGPPESMSFDTLYSFKRGSWYTAINKPKGQPAMTKKNTQQEKNVIAAVMGLTRNRKYVTDIYADDESFWTGTDIVPVKSKPSTSFR